MTTVDHGLDLEAIRAELNAEDWEDDLDRQIRTIYLGTVFNLTPSGKMYMPWACANLAPCPCCGGTGIGHTKLRRRTIKKRKARTVRAQRIVNGRMNGSAVRTPEDDAPHEVRLRLVAKWRQANRLSGQPTCSACGGCGSREAYLDELWREAADEAVGSIGCYITGSEGDPCDLLVCESRDKPEEDESEDTSEGRAHQPEKEDPA